MKPSNQCCNPSRLDDYLNERLGEDDQAEFEQHLTGCQTCRTELENRAAEPDLWRDAEALIGVPDRIASGDGAPIPGDSGHTHQASSVLDSLSPTDDPEMLGRIGDYEISGVVGVGGMGAVLKGYDRSLRRVVAIKVMAPHLAGSGSARARFGREARAAAAITHDNVIDTYGVSEANGLPYLVMPFARGPSLQKRIDESGPLTAVEIVRIGRQIAAGLAAAHEQGLVHRDIKPANILLNEGIERLWITDFGVARAMDDASMTQTGVIAGTPQYMSPEQARGECVDHRSDLFSLGSILYTACTGRPPFRSEAAYGILRRITDTDPRPIRDINPDTPPWLCRVVQRLMAKHPADRFQTAEEVAELLEDCVAHLQQPSQVALPASVAAGHEMERPPQSDRQLPGSPATPRTRFQPAGIWVTASSILLAALAVVAFQVINPANISGQWAGENWKNVSLLSVEEAADWYTGSFTDSQGRRGALQLEWSRLQRRYNGRWKVGDQQAGSITLRIGDSGTVRGAISVDPDSRTPSSDPRLREFSWKRTIIDQTHSVVRSQVIKTPVKGMVVYLSNKISENARIKQGDLIARIAKLSAEDAVRQEEQVSAAKKRVETAEATLKANRRNLDALQPIVDACKSQVATFEQMKQQTVESADATLRAAGERLSQAQKQLDRHQAELSKARNDLTRGRSQDDQNAISKDELQTLQHTVESRNLKLEFSKRDVAAAENALAAQQQDARNRTQKAQVNLGSATTELKKAEADVVAAENEIAKAEADLARGKQELVDLIQKQKELVRLEIVAPFDGVVTQITPIEVRQTLREGDTICRITPDVPEDVLPP